MTDNTSTGQALGNAHEETVLNWVAASEIVQKLADRFFSRYGLTRAQFNILVLIRESREGGLTPVEIGREMIVTAANVRTHMSRLEQAGLIVRTAKDRRTNPVNLTAKAKKLLNKIDKPYFQQIDQIMGALTMKENKELARILAKLRDILHEEAQRSSQR